MRTPVPPVWQLERDRSGILVRLSGDWLVRTSGLKDAADRQRFLAALGKDARVRFDASELRRWDSALIIFIWDLQKAVAARGCEHRLGPGRERSRWCQTEPQTHLS